MTKSLWKEYFCKKSKLGDWGKTAAKGKLLTNFEPIVISMFASTQYKRAPPQNVFCIQFARSHKDTDLSWFLEEKNWETQNPTTRSTCCWAVKEREIQILIWKKSTYVLMTHFKKWTFNLVWKRSNWVVQCGKGVMALWLGRNTKFKVEKSRCGNPKI